MRNLTYVLLVIYSVVFVAAQAQIEKHGGLDENRNLYQRKVASVKVVADWAGNTIRRKLKNLDSSFQLVGFDLCIIAVNVVNLVDF